MNDYRARELWLWSLAVIAVIMVAVAATFNIDRMVDNQKEVRHTREVQLNYAMLIADLTKIQSSYRGFLITSDPDYLAPYHRGKNQYDEHFKFLKTATLDNESQQKRLADLGVAIDDFLRIVQGILTLHDTAGAAVAELSFKEGHGKVAMERIRASIREGLAEEDRLLQERETEALDQNRTAHITSYAAAGLGVAIILIAAALIHSGQRRRMKTAAALVIANAKLAATNAKVLESERRFRQLAEAMPQFVWMTRPDGHAEYFNARWFDYTGLTPEQSLGANWSTPLHPEDRDRSIARWAFSTRTGEPYEVEFRLRRHDGAYRWFLARAQPIRDEADTILRWLGTCTDIDENKRIEGNLERIVAERTAALSEQRAFLDAILNNVSEGIVACDAKGHLLFNRATKEMHGLGPEEIPVTEWSRHYNLFAEDGTTPLTAENIPLARAYRGEAVRNANMIIHPHEQTPRYVQCSGQPLLNPQQQVIGAVVSMRDMTERRQYEQDLLASTELLKQSNEELEKFAYIASHDLQEPLRKIQAFGDRLLRKSRAELDLEGQECVDRMLDAAARMRRLIEDLLAFSRVSSKALAFKPLQLGDVLNDVLSTFEVRLEQCGGRVEIGSLPAVEGDASQLRQLFQNLIGNAIKFARPGVPPEIVIHAEAFENLPDDADPPKPEGAGWRIRVRDNGIGFEQQYAERIFELFQRLHGRGQYDGTGLGLAICRKIAQRHGILLTVRSQPGDGATFTLDWPPRND